MKNIILHIDYDSFFASVEQQANPILRNKPIAVTGSSVRKGIVTAASIQAKKYGVKTAMPFYKAKKLCPNLIPVKGDATKYSYISKETQKIFNKYTDLVEPFSIDESFLDITKTVKFFGSPVDVAYLIKKDIKESFGEYITCSIGIGPNKLIAKLVSDINKPNGLFIVTDQNINEVLQMVELKDFCGIGHRTEKKLNELNIKNVYDLQRTSLNFLYDHFGNVMGSFLKNASMGISFDNVKSFEHKRQIKSISHQHTLSKNTKDHKIIKANFRRLSEMVAKRMRNNNVKGRTISIWIRDKNKNSHGARKTIFSPTDSGNFIYKISEELFNEMKWNKEVRLVAVAVSNLNSNRVQINSLFPEEMHDQKINETIDKINDKFGKFTIIPANTIKADKTKDKISSFLKHH